MHDRFVAFTIEASKTKYRFVVDLEVKRLYKVRGYGTYGDFIYDKNVEKLIFCDNNQLDGFGHVTIIDLITRSVSESFGVKSDKYVYSCNGFDGESLEYKVSWVVAFKLSVITLSLVHLMATCLSIMLISKVM